MLQLQKISLRRGSKTLFENLNLSVYEKNIIGIIGANGCGKSSLFGTIKGEIEINSGNIEIRKDVQINSIEQEVPALSTSALNYVISGDNQLFTILEKLAYAEKHQNYEMVMQCHTQLHETDGYSSEAKAAKILIGLGFSQDQLNQAVKTFSGGWRMRLNLAKCLFAPSDLLLLDEPTNHLDMETIIWLEEFLKSYAGAIVLVSHDRDFLDHITTHILHIENQTGKVYTGNYSAFEILYAQFIALQKSQYKKQQTQITHMMKFVERFRAKATKAKQAQSRLKAISKIELVAPVYESLPFTFEFQKPDRTSNPIITMKNVTLGYDDKIILKKINLSIMVGERIGLLGINGAGKSTLIKALVGEVQPIEGRIDRPANAIGYFAQHQIDYMPLEESPLYILKNCCKHKTEKELLNFLGGFNFNRDQSLSPLKYFSGGEKARFALARIISQKPSLLLLDEPTNHLDLEVRQALMLALQKYEGTLLLVSHDRYLMRTLVDDLYIVHNQKVERFIGAVEEYQDNK